MERDLPAWASDYVGLPYVRHGRDRSGVDCWGLIGLVWREALGRPLPAYEGVDWFDGQKAALIGTDALAYASQFSEIPPGEERLGDGVLMRMRGHPFHVGIVLSPGWMLHTHEAAGSVIEPYRCPRWENRITAFYRPFVDA